MQKFTAQIAEVRDHVRGDPSLPIPDIKFTDASQLQHDFAAIAELESALNNWITAIDVAVQQEQMRTISGNSPLAEIQFWRHRNAKLSPLFEVLNLPNLKRYQTAITKLGLEKASVFRSHFNELSKLYIEAKDNVKFLTTLERHFKNISRGKLSQIQDTIPSMMNAIRMVWIISRHYNTDERVVPLMELIASEIAAKVADKIDVKKVFRKEPEEAISTINTARAVLESWFTTYMDVRDKIEKTGTDHRWEFDKRRLFDKTKYMVKICADLHYIATSLQEFFAILGPGLKDVTGDGEKVDLLIAKVQGLVVPLESVNALDIFNPKHQAHWDKLVQAFKRKMVEIEEETTEFIDNSFKKLRSAESAFNLLENFQEPKSRETINAKLSQKFDDILKQYSHELDKLRELFEMYRDSPPMYKNYPPTAGAISWASSLFKAAKKPIMRFVTMRSLLETDTGEHVKKKYMHLAQEIDEYIQQKYDAWNEVVVSTAAENLRKSVLGPEHIPTEKPKPPPEDYFVNFSQDLIALIREGKYLDRLGFEVPDMVLNITLQEDKYHKSVMRCSKMLVRYQRLLTSLSEINKDLLQKQLAELSKVMDQGFDPINWNSLHIPAYIDNCNKAIDAFEGTLEQIKSSTDKIEEVVQQIATTLLVSDSDFEPTSHEISELLDVIESRRCQRVDKLVNKYHDISSLLLKVEETVATTNTGSSPALKQYYLYWEKRLCNAISSMIVSSLSSLQMLLNIEPEGLTAIKREHVSA